MRSSFLASVDVTEFHTTEAYSSLGLNNNNNNNNNKTHPHTSFSLAQQPKAGQSSLIPEVSRPLSRAL
jgi:hypothetical protein